LKARWQAEKAGILELRQTKEEIESKKAEEARMERQGDLAKVAELRHGTLPKLNDKMKGLEEKQAALQKEGALLKEEVTEQDVAGVVAKWTGIPVARMLESETAKLIHIEDRLRQRVVGQEEALGLVANAIRRSRAGLSDPKRPTGVFLFVGPTGVGKTELARSLAQFLFDDENQMVRIDMSEYMEKFSVSRLIGAPPGYVGYDEGGQLTEAVRRRPYSVVLFDEIGKAHPDVFNVLLQVMDDGRLTDSQGRVVDFKNTVLIMTSNVGSQRLADVMTGTDKDMQREILADLKTSFKPEFLNRIDAIVPFHRLGMEQLKAIVGIQLKELQARLAERKVELEVSPKALEKLADAGFDPVYGARPLKRVIQQELADPLAMKMLEGTVKEGDTVKVEVEKGKFVFG
jgi:ATP-dependent Clp protease ATP-binding subunit ClpB